MQCRKGTTEELAIYQFAREIGELCSYSYLASYFIAAFANSCRSKGRMKAIFAAAVLLSLIAVISCQNTCVENEARNRAAAIQANCYIADPTNINVSALEIIGLVENTGHYIHPLTIN